MADLYPEIEPYDHGMLEVGDGQRLYWEVSGNPEGKPVVFLHGGPGGATSPKQRRLFDPGRYRVVLFDQRGCGRSTPHLSDPAASLDGNTTWDLVADIERLREQLGVERWMAFGGSWGSTLALAYAQRHPDRVTELVLRGIFAVRRSEIDWLYNGGSAPMFPEGWRRFLEPVPEADRDRDMIEVFHELLNDPDPGVHGPAALAWSRWEGESITLLPRQDVLDRFTEPAFSLAFARIENHYFRHGAWLEPGQLIRDAGKLADIPGVIVQGRYDVVTPTVTAWELHQAWPESELTIIGDAGHAFDEPGILNALIEATDRFAG